MHRGDDGANRYPGHAWRVAVRPQPIENRQRDCDEHHEHQPAEDLEDPAQHPSPEYGLQQRRQHRDDSEHDHHEDDGAEGQPEGHQPLLDEAAFLFLVVGDIDRRQQVADPGRGAPQRDRDRDNEADTEGRAPRGQRGDLIGDDLLGLFGQCGGHRVQLVRDRRRVGEESVDDTMAISAGKMARKA